MSPSLIRSNRRLISGSQDLLTVRISFQDVRQCCITFATTNMRNTRVRNRWLDDIVINGTRYLGYECSRNWRQLLPSTVKRSSESIPMAGCISTTGAPAGSSNAVRIARSTLISRLPVPKSLRSPSSYIRVFLFTVEFRVKSRGIRVKDSRVRFFGCPGRRFSVTVC